MWISYEHLEIESNRTNKNVTAVAAATTTTKRATTTGRKKNLEKRLQQIVIVCERVEKCPNA